MKHALFLGLAAASLQLLGSSAANAEENSPMSLAPPSPATDGPGSVPVVGYPDPLALLQDADPARSTNKRLVFDMWRSIVNAGHTELADRMLQEGYIQHSPILPTGREAFKKIFSVVKRTEIPDLVSPPLVTILAEKNLVVMALLEQLPEPGGKGTYTSTHFNMFRIEDGRLAEHWHSVQDAPSARVLSPQEGGPQRVTGASGSAQYVLLSAADPALAANKRLVFDAWRQTAEAGRDELAGLYFKDGYVEHDPNWETGLRGLKSRVAAQADTAIETSLQYPLVALVAQGDLVVLVTAREHPHPALAGETYTTTWFDMFRIEDGLIAEHWDGASKPGTPTIDYGN